MLHQRRTARCAQGAYHTCATNATAKTKPRKHTWATHRPGENSSNQNCACNAACCRCCCCRRLP
eukprot:8010446-Alexandrium_andersonii.AAC.1